MMRHTFSLALFLPLLISSASSSKLEPFPKPIVSLSAMDLPSEKFGATGQDFAISPSNDKIAVLFRVQKGGRTSEYRIGLWEIATKKLMHWTTLQHPVPSPGYDFQALSRETVRFTSDGSKLLVEAGEFMYVIGAEDTRVLYEIRIFQDATPAEQGGFLSTLSSDGSTFAILTGQTWSGKIGMVSVYGVDSGQKIAQWSLDRFIKHAVLSADGHQILLIKKPPFAPSIVESKTGPPVMYLDTGFGPNPRVSGTWIKPDRVAFVDEDDPSGNVRFVHIIGLEDGGLKEQLGYNKLGFASTAWASQDGSTLALLFLRASWWKYHFTENGVTGAELLLYRNEDPTPTCRVGPLPEPKVRPLQSGFIRFSSDLKIVGLFIQNQVFLYSMPQCN